MRRSAAFRLPVLVVVSLLIAAGVLVAVVAAPAAIAAPGPVAAAPPTTPGAVVSLPPARIMDTRIGQGAAGPVPASGTVSVQVTGQGGVPVSGVSAVAVNVTVADPAAAGYVTVWPSGSSPPLSSNLNFQAGQNIPNLVIVPVGADGKIQLSNGSPGTVQLIADVAGYILDGCGEGNV